MPRHSRVRAWGGSRAWGHVSRHVMRGPDPRIHETLQRSKSSLTLPPPKVGMDCRVKPGNGVVGMCVTAQARSRASPAMTVVERSAFPPSCPRCPPSCQGASTTSCPAIARVRAWGGRGLARQLPTSCAGLTRASMTHCGRSKASPTLPPRGSAWIAGSSPAMTSWECA